MGTFSNLRPLSLSWCGPGRESEPPHVAEVSVSSSAAIGKIASLEQLRLSAGEEFSWRCQWLVDHEILRTHLARLTNLKKLAICYDTYPVYDLPVTESYYRLRLVQQDEQTDAAARPELDEDTHQSDSSMHGADGYTIYEDQSPNDREGGMHPEHQEQPQYEGLSDSAETTSDDMHPEFEEQSQDEMLSDIAETTSDDSDKQNIEGSQVSDQMIDDNNDDGISPDDIWERAHRNRMLTQAEKYAAAIPSLEWIYCGQLPMAFKEPQDGAPRVAIPPARERDKCLTLLSRMFAMGVED